MESGVVWPRKTLPFLLPIWLLNYGNQKCEVQSWGHWFLTLTGFGENKSNLALAGWAQ